MKYFSVPMLFCCLLTLLLEIHSASAQSVVDISPMMSKEFAKVEDLMNSFNNDSARIILIQLMEELSTKKELESAFGIKVQLRYAEALERDDQDEEAIEKLLDIAEVSQKNKRWGESSDAYLSLARLYEKIGRWDNCLNSLKNAKSVIIQNEVDSIYPRFSIRMSSYHRLNGQADSAIFYAKEVVRTAPKWNQYTHHATGNLLLGMLLSRSSYKEAIRYYQAAGQYWKSVADYNGYGAILANLSTLHMRNARPQLALVYTDSAIMVAQKGAKVGIDPQYTFARMYLNRGNIFKQMGRLDSALFYLDKGYQMQLEAVYASNNDKIVEIDARYKNEKKEKVIAEQAFQIQIERERQYVLWGIFSILLFFAFLLGYYYYRLRKANRKTEQQALTIKDKNEDLSKSLQRQIMLQSEVHHRVKNNLQVIISLLELQMEEAKNPIVQENFESMSNRIYSMAAIHEILYEQEDTAQVNLAEYAENLCMHFSNFSKIENKPKFDLNIEKKYFSLETSMPLGIILTELLTNSLKYGRVEGQKLEIKIELEKVANEYCFHYRDNGPGFPNQELEERKGGLGTYLLKSMSRQLNGHIKSKNDGGATFQIFFKEKNNRIL